MARKINHKGARVTPAMITALMALVHFDPIDTPHNIGAILAVSQACPTIAQVACFDNACYRTFPPVAQQFALSGAISEASVRRSGLHGLSHEYIARRQAEDVSALSQARVVVAHLGAGASLCALYGGVSIDTTFGFSVVGGLPMATCCGSLDPGAIQYLVRLGHSLACGQVDVRVMWTDEEPMITPQHGYSAEVIT